MEWFIKAFIRASVLWFAAGILLGVGMALYPQWIIYRPAHAHMNVAGFLTMMVFGVGYQLLPRVFGAPLYSRALAVVHLYLANIGLLGMVAGFMLQPHAPTAGRWILSSGGVLFAIGVVLWAWNLWQTFNAADARDRARARAGQKQLPTMNE